MSTLAGKVGAAIEDAYERGLLRGLQEALHICRCSEVVCANEAAGKLEAIIERVEHRRGN
jgi:hypothetical protein